MTNRSNKAAIKVFPEPNGLLDKHSENLEIKPNDQYLEQR